MASSREGSESRRTTSGESASPSKRSDETDGDATGPLRDPLEDALAPRRDPGTFDRPRRPRSPAEPSPGAEIPPRFGSRPRPRPQPQTRGGRRVKPMRRVRRTVQHVDPVTVLKLSVIFYAVFLVLWLMFVAVVYWLLQAAGLFDRLEEILGPNGLVVEDSFDISLWSVEKWAFLIGLTFAVLASLFNLFLAFLYNVAADVVGGVQVTFVERDF
jgi:hypothetical protein